MATCEIMERKLIEKEKQVTDLHILCCELEIIERKRGTWDKGARQFIKRLRKAAKRHEMIYRQMVYQQKQHS